MEEKLLQIHSEVQELGRAVRNISQFASVISDRLATNDQKLDTILNRLSPARTITSEHNCNEANLLVSSNVVSSAEPERPEPKTTIKKPAEKEKKCTGSGNNNYGSTKLPSATGIFPFNLSAPSIPQLVIEKVRLSAKVMPQLCKGVGCYWLRCALHK